MRLGSLDDRAYLATVAIIVGLLGAALFAGVRYFSIPPALAPGVGVNARLQFLRTTPPPPGAILVLGASIAANSVDTDLLQAIERRPFVNVGAYGLGVADHVRMYRLMRELQSPREVIFVGQYYEFGHDRSGLPASDDVLGRYLTGGMSFLEEGSYFQLPMLRAYASNWARLRGRTDSSSVAFNRTGSIPLDMDARKSDPEHLTARILTTPPCNDCMAPLAQLCRAVVGDGKRFTAVLAPLQLSAIADLPRHRAMRADRRARIRQTLDACGGTLIDGSEAPAFDDGCFADYSHLNVTGAAIFTRALIAHRAGRPADLPAAIRCD
jgi:hypothetical protein